MSYLFHFYAIDPIDVLFTLIFILFAFCTVYPPQEFIAAGVTWENIFAKLLGSEDVFFFEFHLRRTALLRIIWSFYPLVYYCTLHCLSDNVSESPHLYPPFTLWDIVLWLGVGCSSFITMHTYLVWYANGTWSGHPTCAALRKLAISNDQIPLRPPFTERWHQYVSDINAECRRPDKFMAGHGNLSSSWPGRRVIVTDSWILYSHFTQFKVLKQSSDRLVAVVASATSVMDIGSLTEGGRPAGDNLGTQTMVTVRFVQPQNGSCVLTFGLPAFALEDLRIKLQCPLIRAEGVELEPTVVQRFIEAFRKIVRENGVVPDNIRSSEVEQCIGCMSTPANVILMRRCDPESHSTLDRESEVPVVHIAPCGNCRCRPMWCLECMARWFAARQTEAHRPPTTWLSGRVPCPTCRTVFCVRDVIQLSSNLTADM